MYTDPTIAAAAVRRDTSVCWPVVEAERLRRERHVPLRDRLRRKRH